MMRAPRQRRSAGGIAHLWEIVRKDAGGDTQLDEGAGSRVSAPAVAAVGVANRSVYAFGTLLWRSSRFCAAMRNGALGPPKPV